MQKTNFLAMYAHGDTILVPDLFKAGELLFVSKEEKLNFSEDEFLFPDIVLKPQQRNQFSRSSLNWNYAKVKRLFIPHKKYSDDLHNWIKLVAFEMPNYSQSGYFPKERCENCFCEDLSRQRPQGIDCTNTYLC